MKKKRFKNIIFPVFLAFFLTGSCMIYAGSKTPPDWDRVDFISVLPTPGEFTLFANGGWDGNWYVGINQGWSAKLVLPDREYNELYMGARLGRSKTAGQIKQAAAVSIYTAAAQEIIDSLENKVSDGKLLELREVFEKGIDENTPNKLQTLLEDDISGQMLENFRLGIERAIARVTEISGGPYKIVIGISENRDTRPEGRVLILNSDIPREGSEVTASEDISDSRWFWIKADRGKLPAGGNSVYLHLWTEDAELNNTDTAPILAGGIGSDEAENTYIVTGEGYKTIKYFKPALALKGVIGKPASFGIEINNIKKHPSAKGSYVISLKNQGSKITGSWIQIKEGKSWNKIGRYIDKPPYIHVLNMSRFPSGRYTVRAVAEHWPGGTVFSATENLVVE